jgi:LacI family transcriptional regulator
MSGCGSIPPIRQPIALMADSAIETLLRSIRRKTTDTRVLVDHVVAHQLIQRDSVAPPRES